MFICQTQQSKPKQSQPPLAFGSFLGTDHNCCPSVGSSWGHEVRLLWFLYSSMINTDQERKCNLYSAVCLRSRQWIYKILFHLKNWLCLEKCDNFRHFDLGFKNIDNQSRRYPGVNIEVRSLTSPPQFTSLLASKLLRVLFATGAFF